MNPDLMGFILEIIYLIKKGWGICNKSDEYSDIGTQWIALYVNTKSVTYFYSFGIEHIPK